MFSNPYAILNVVFAARLLNGLHVKNFPIRLKLQLYIACILPSSEMGIISSSSDVSFILPNPSATSSAILLKIPNNERKINTLRPRSREGRLVKHERENSTAGRKP